MSILTRVALPVLAGFAVMAMAAQEPRIYTPDSPPAAGDVTVLNTKIVSVDTAQRRMTVTVDKKTRDGRVDRAATRTFAVAERGALALGDLRKGMEVMLTLRGETVIDVRVSTPASGAEGARPGDRPGTGVISTGGTTTTIERGGGTVTTGATSTTTTTTGTVTITEPAATAAPPVAGATVGPPATRPAVSPAPAGPTRAPVSPQAVPTPRPVSTPRPVILPSDPPPTPIPPVSPPPTPPAPRR